MVVVMRNYFPNPFPTEKREIGPYPISLVSSVTFPFYHISKPFLLVVEC